MCGIFAAVNAENVVHKILTGLRDCEYRGYDSYGLIASNESVVRAINEVGKVGEHNLVNEPLFKGTGIGHTRWATHGEVNKKNTHPISTPGSRFHIVHNGTIDTDLVLKYFPYITDYDFITDTDTEYLLKAVQYNYNIIPNIYNEHIRVQLAIDNTIRGLGYPKLGSFLLFDPFSEKREVYWYSNGTPLYKTYGDSYYISSDLNALSRHSNNASKIEGTKLQGTVKLNFIETQKTDEPFMLKEIKEQVNLCKIDEVKLLGRYNQFTFVGCGSSYYAGKIVSNLLRHPNIGYIKYASEFTPNTTVHNYTDYVFISQSGETKDTIDAANLVVKYPFGPPTVVVQNRENSTLSEMCNRAKDYSINVNVGPEIGVAATKSVFRTIIELSAEKNDNGEELAVAVKEVIDNSTRYDKEYREISKYRNILFLGQGVYYPIAQEAALKMKEIAYIHAEAIPASEIKHGPIALIDDSTLTIVLASPKEYKYQSVIDNINQVKSRGGKVFTFSEEINSHTIFPLPKLYEPNYAQPLIFLVAMQLLAYNVATILGYDVDKPRNLAKSVTV